MSGRDHRFVLPGMGVVGGSILWCGRCCKRDLGNVVSYSVCGAEWRLAHVSISNLVKLLSGIIA